MFCNHCGAQVVDYAKFCNKCGNKLSAESEPQLEPYSAPSGGYVDIHDDVTEITPDALDLMSDPDPSPDPDPSGFQDISSGFRQQPSEFQPSTGFAQEPTGFQQQSAGFRQQSTAFQQQNTGFQQQTYSAPSGYSPANGYDLNSYSSSWQPLGVGEYIVMFLIGSVPILGLIMLIVWATSSTENPNKRNYAKAALIMMAIGIGIFILFSTVITTMLMSLVKGSYYY